MPLPERERLARWRLVRSERIGPTTVLELLRRHGSAEAALAAIAGQPR